MKAVLVSFEELTYPTIDPEHGCMVTSDCAALVEHEYVDTFYANPKHPLSVVEFPDTAEEYERRTCSKVVRENARHCERLGYRYDRIDRAEWEDDLYELRASATVRQGRRMPAAYLEWQSYGHDVPSGCPRHGYTVHGVIGADGKLAGYVQLFQCGEVVRVNTILGHADRLADRVMWLLMLRAFQWHIDERQARFGLYYTHHSGHGDGLRYWKERFGMRPARVTWAL